MPDNFQVSGLPPGLVRLYCGHNTHLGFLAHQGPAGPAIAGLCDPTGRILGLMPHPERFVDVTQHPEWTRGGVRRGDGNLFFQGAFLALK